MNLQIYNNILEELRGYLLTNRTNNNTIGDDRMDIDKIKGEIQRTTKHYIVGVKFITTETPENVINSINRDLNIYDVYRFIITDKTIEIGLESNATPVVYYCEDAEKFTEICTNLKKICEAKNITFTKI